MKEKRAYQYKELAAAGIDTAAYTPMKTVGRFTGTLDAKAWGRRMNMVLFLTLDSGEKVVANVWQRNGYKDTAPYYKGMDEVPMGARVEVLFSHSRKGNVRLEDIRRIAPSV